MKHYVLTRFNLGKPEDGEYWEIRKRLFEEYCLPSMIAQTNQDFTWLVLFDKDTARMCRQRIAYWERSFKPFRHVYFNSMSRVRQDIRVACEGHSHVLTTRLDCDDLFHREALDRIRKAAEARKADEPVVIDFPHGYHLYLPDELRAYNGPWNMFLSLVEPVETDDNLHTCLAKSHHNMKVFKTYHDETAPPMWIWLRHGTNLSPRDKHIGVLMPYFAADMEHDFAMGRGALNELMESGNAP